MPVKKSLSAVIKLFNNRRIHFESCKGSEKQNITYCTKDGNWFSNFYSEPEKLEIIEEFAPWMTELTSILQNKANKRHVYWIHEPIGGSVNPLIANTYVINSMLFILTKAKNQI